MTRGTACTPPMMDRQQHVVKKCRLHLPLVVCVNIDGVDLLYRLLTLFYIHFSHDSLSTSCAPGFLFQIMKYYANKFVYSKQSL